MKQDSRSKPEHEPRNPKADAKDVVRLPENKEMSVKSGTSRLLTLILAIAD
jgi:flagellar basal body rod protein FlgC